MYLQQLVGTPDEYFSSRIIIVTTSGTPSKAGVVKVAQSSKSYISGFKEMWIYIQDNEKNINGLIVYFQTFVEWIKKMVKYRKMYVLSLFWQVYKI